MIDQKSQSTPLYRKLILAASTLVVGLAAAEGLNRVRLWAIKRPYDAESVRAELQREHENLDQLIQDAGDPGDGQRKENVPQVLHPYTGFDLLPAIDGVSRDVAYFKTPEAEEAFDIVIFGGSVANGFYRDVRDYLLELLAEDPRFEGRPMRFIRYARPGFKQPQQLTSLITILALGVRPDAVINLDGFNEVAVANHNRRYDAHPLQPAVGQWSLHVADLLEREDLLEALLDLRLARRETDALAGRGASSKWLWSSFVGNWYLGRVREGRRRQVRPQEGLTWELARGTDNPVVRGPDWEGDLDEVMRFCVANWKSASIYMDAICKTRSIYYLHVLQPTLYAPGTRVPTEGELERGKASDSWMDAVRVGYPLLVEAGRELQAEGVQFLDATLVFKDVKAPIYVDACHFRMRGNRLLAELMAPAFLAGYEGE